MHTVKVEHYATLPGSTLRILTITYNNQYSAATLKTERDIMGDGSVWVPLTIDYILPSMGFDVQCDARNDAGQDVMLFAQDMAHVGKAFIEDWHKVAA